MVQKLKTVFFELLFLTIITIPAFIVLLNTNYFSMHDDQHIARLFLLDRGIRQGILYPRWVGGLGFGFGYPLFNFYPPVVYYLAELFHLTGLSLIWSVKLVFITGFFVAAAGMYLLIRNVLGRIPAALGSIFYTYFFYHAVNAYVRGALAEFFSMAVLPFVFWSLHRLASRESIGNMILFGTLAGLLIITHPLIAVPAVFFIGVSVLFYIPKQKNKTRFMAFVVGSAVLGLGLSAFFWLPSSFERMYTMVDPILTRELASYKIHFVCPWQFVNSPWGYGGSIAGCFDGMTFQLGAVHLILFISSLIVVPVFLLKGKLKSDRRVGVYYFLSLLLFTFSLFMAVDYSSFIWASVSYLWYLQFPWRFLTFAGLYLSVLGSYTLYVIYRWNRIAALIALIVIGGFAILKYQKYFKPARLLQVNDTQLTTFDEIAWRVSGTSFEFVPKGVDTAVSRFGTTVLNIQKKDLPTKPYTVVSGSGTVDTVEDRFEDKRFRVTAETPIVMRFNTFFFPGWVAYVDGRPITISSDNRLKLITMAIPAGSHSVRLLFTDTPVRKAGNWISLLTFAVVIASCVYEFKKIKR